MKLFSKPTKANKYHLPSITSVIALATASFAMFRAVKETKKDIVADPEKEEKEA